jgi:hypothetical protein
VRNDPKRGRKFLKVVKEMLENCPKCKGTGKIKRWSGKWSTYIIVVNAQGEREYLLQPCNVCGKVRLLLKELGL